MIKRCHSFAVAVSHANDFLVELHSREGGKANSNHRLTDPYPETTPGCSRRTIQHGRRLRQVKWIRSRVEETENVECSR